MERNKEVRAFLFDIKAEENDEHGHFLAGQPIVYNSKTDMGWYSEIIEAGALDNTDLKDIPLLVNHDDDMIPVARSRNNNENSTMQFVVTDSGMEIRADLDTENNMDSRALYSAAKRKDISGMSFAFTVDEDRWEDVDTDHPTRHILSIKKIFEVSAVTFPAYEATSLEARSANELDSLKAALESVRAEKRKADAAIKRKKIKLLLEV
ncbi:MAG: HK97 family phage prohead protease [Roseburia sp.]